jgi:hypothetical protein
MRTSRFLSAAIFIGGLAISFSAWAPPGGNGGGGGKKGGNGGETPDLRLCADFNEFDRTQNYIDEDGSATYCDGTDGEILIDQGLKFSTSTRNPAERRVSVYFQGSSCATTRDDGTFDSFEIDRLLQEQGLDTFFANALSTEFEGCDPGDPFDPEFNPDSLLCLSSNGTQLPVGDMRESDGTRYMSMRVNLTDPNLSPKKGGNLLVLTYAEDLGPNDCPTGETAGLDKAALPVAIACTAESGDACSEWRLKAFRACAFDYDVTKGGNWQFGGSGCPVSTDITFTVKQ